MTLQDKVLLELRWMCLVRQGIEELAIRSESCCVCSELRDLHRRVESFGEEMHYSREARNDSSERSEVESDGTNEHSERVPNSSSQEVVTEKQWHIPTVPPRLVVKPPD